jgi:integrase
MTIQNSHWITIKVGIEVSKGYLILRFPRALFNGNQKYLSLNLADTVENQVAAEIQARRIELDILAGYLDLTLAKYKADHTATPKKLKVYYLSYGKSILSLKVVKYRNQLLPVTTH